MAWCMCRKGGTEIGICLVLLEKGILGHKEHGKSLVLAREYIYEYLFIEGIFFST